MNSLIKNCIIIELFLFFLFATLVNNYNILFLLLTFLVITILTKFSANYFIEIISVNEKYLSTCENELSNTGNIKLKIFKLLFQNEQIYKLIKSVSRKNFFRYQIEKLILTSSRKFKQKQPLTLDTPSKLDLEINIFIKKFSFKFIESWYTPFVSNNDQFLNEAQIQLEFIFLDIFKRVKNMDKLNFFANLTVLFNKNFLNVGIGLSLEQITQIPAENLHTAAQNLPASEILYFKRIIQIILRKSSPNLKLNNPLIEELFLQMIGKNCLENLVEILIRPKFIYFSIALLAAKKKTYEKFYAIQNEQTNIAHRSEFEVKEETISDLNSSYDVENVNQFEINDENFQIINEDNKDSLSNEDNQSAISDTISNIKSKDSKDMNFEIIDLNINKTETTSDSKTKFTLYNIEVYLLLIALNFLFLWLFFTSEKFRLRL